MISHRGATVSLSNVLVDTGSASTLINANIAATVGIVPQPDDHLRTLRGVGGREVVFTRRIDRVEVGGKGLEPHANFPLILDGSGDIFARGAPGGL